MFPNNMNTQKPKKLPKAYMSPFPMKTTAKV